MEVEPTRGAGWRWQFASDNTSGICPEALAALQAANQGFAPSYGDDMWTALACDALREVFETRCEVFFVFNGTAANSLALASLCQSYHSVVCAETAHVETDECGGPEFFSNGTKLWLAPSPDGKLKPDAVRDFATRRSDPHYPRPRVVSITQPTELGTLYDAVEIAALAEAARQHGLKVHMDGARFSNAVATLGVPPRALTWQAGVDVLCLGGTKMGLPLCEAIVFFDSALAEEFAYRCKQAGQLASKMRFLSAPWLGVLRDGVWLDHARHANHMAAQLAEKLSAIPGVQLVFPCRVNAVFARLPAPAVERLRNAGWHYYNFIGDAARFMCSWATTAGAVDELARAVETAVAM